MAWDSICRFSIECGPVTLANHTTVKCWGNRHVCQNAQFYDLLIFVKQGLSLPRAALWPNRFDYLSSAGIKGMNHDVLSYCYKQAEITLHYCLCLDQKLMASYFCVASNLELHLTLCVSCLTGLSPQIEPKILGWFLSRQPHPYLEGMLWLPAKAVLWKTHCSFSEVVFTR